MKPGDVRVSTIARVIAAAALIFVSEQLPGATYQVGPARSHTNLQAVARLLAPGDVVEVDGDATYPGNATFDNSGTAAYPITIRGRRVNGKRPVISGVNGFSGGAVVRFRANHYLFEGFEVTAGGDLDTARGVYNLGDHVTVRDCVVRDCPGTGVSGAAVAGSFTLHGVEIHHCGAGSTAHQIYVASDNLRHPDAVFRMEFCYVHDGNGGNNVKSRVSRNEIYFNWIEGAYYHELDLIGADPTEQPPGTADLVREDSDVVGNVFYKTASAGGGIARCGTDGTGSSNGRFRFVNNTMVFDPNWDVTYGVFKLQGPRESVEMHNNVFHRGGARLFMIRETDWPSSNPNGISGSRNWVPSGSTGMPAAWTGTIFGTNPAFADLAGFDFTPAPDSPLRDAAQLPTPNPVAYPFPTPLQTMAFLPPRRALNQPGAIAARPDNGAVDIGAFEQSGSPPPVIARPVIITPPLSRQVNAGADVTFTAEATGTPPLAWQWRFNGDNLPGASDASFTVSNAQPAQAGNYSVVVTNAAGEARSDDALLSFNEPPSITLHPVSRSLLVGATATFNARAAGTPPLFLQWRFNGTDIPGATATNFVIASVQFTNAGAYALAVTNIAGAATSSNATLIVLPDTNRPSALITSPPGNARLSNDMVTVIGTAADNARVAAVLCQWNDTNTPFAPVSGLNSWSVTLPLTPGTNTIRVKSVDVAGNESLVAARKFFRVVLSRLTTLINGDGRFSTNLDGALLEMGRSYKITALPGTNQVFTHWNGGANSTNAALVFLMQSNLVLQANFKPNPFLPLKGAYSGLFAESNAPVHASAGFFSLTLTDRGTANGKIFVDGNTFSVSAKFDLAGKASTSVSRARAGKAPLLVNLDLDFDDLIPGTDQILGSVSSDAWAASLRANRHVWSNANPATAYTNSSTLILPRDDAGLGPAGNGYGLVTVDALGRVRLSGQTGDGAALSQLATVSKDGEWPLYVPLYTGALSVTNGASVTFLKEFKGSLWGWVSFAGGEPRGSVFWTKTSASTNIFFPGGFTNRVSLVASRYVAPAPGQRALAMTNGVLVVAGGNLPEPFTNHFTLGTNNALVMTAADRPLTLSLYVRNGQLKGAFLNPANPLRATTVAGAVLQRQNAGHGLFLGTNAAGFFTLQPE